MKRYILGIVLFMEFGNLLAKHTAAHLNFNKNFSKWYQKNIESSKVHQEYMKEFLSEYKKQYDLVEKSNEKFDKDLLNKYQEALTTFMNNWNFYYYHIPIKAFNEKVGFYKNRDEFQKYFKLYEKYDKKPADSNLRIKVEQEQKKLEALMAH